MTPNQAFQILHEATQPAIQLTRMDYVRIEEALQVIAERLKIADKSEEPIETSEPDPKLVARGSPVS